MTRTSMGNDYGWRSLWRCRRSFGTPIKPQSYSPAVINAITAMSFTFFFARGAFWYATAASCYLVSLCVLRYYTQKQQIEEEEQKRRGLPPDA